jgi:hypothetical protein
LPLLIDSEIRLVFQNISATAVPDSALLENLLLLASFPFNRFGCTISGHQPAHKIIHNRETTAKATEAGEP